MAATQNPAVVPVSTRYITSSVTSIGTGETKTFIASLCKQFQGETVNATVLLNNNPQWLTKTGVIYYYIVDDPKKVNIYKLHKRVQLPSRRFFRNVTVTYCK